jgi:hypothetical protein
MDDGAMGGLGVVIERVRHRKLDVTIGKAGSLGRPVGRPETVRNYCSVLLRVDPFRASAFMRRMTAFRSLSTNRARELAPRNTSG